MTHPIDHHIARVLRRRRKLLRLTQAQLAERAGIDHRQVHKYETAANRLTVSRLWTLSLALEIPIATVFSGLEEG